MEINILIVDDISKNIQVLGSILEKADYSISFATDGRKALKMVKEEDYDLILLDIMMPEMDGFEVCRRIKKIPGKSNIPVIFLTARNQKKDVVKGMEAGAADYVTKPFHSAELMARVDTHLQLKKAKDEIEEKNRELEKRNERLLRINADLKTAMDRIKKLEGIIPICAHCKRVRDDKGYWDQVESYMSRHTEAEFSHGICPDCAKKHYPEFLGGLDI